MINIILILFMLLFLFKSYLCINIKNQIIMDGDKQKVNELTMRTLGSHYGGYAYVKVKNRQTDVNTISSRETYRSAEHRVYAQMNKLTEAGAMISLAIELLTSNIRHSYGEINFERHPRPVEVEGEDKH